MACLHDSMKLNSKLELALLEILSLLVFIYYKYTWDETG